MKAGALQDSVLELSQGDAGDDILRKDGFLRHGGGWKAHEGLGNRDDGVGGMR